MTYKGKFKPKNVNKYNGDYNNIYYRSSWELSLMVWLDNNPNVKNWSSETVVIPYLCEIDKKIHRYFPDFKITFDNNKTYLVEVKPENQTTTPVKRSRKTKKYINESIRYIQNISKWKAAKKYAEDRNWIFSIWTENTLKKIGIKIII